MASKDRLGEGPITIKKYANRRLYNTLSSNYITLDDLARMTREGLDFQVLDAKSGNDITHAILTQIIMEEESNGEQMLPVSFLRQLIAMYGNSMQSIMPQYLEASMDNFRANQSELKAAFSSDASADVFSQVAEGNIAMFKASAEVSAPNCANSNGISEHPDQHSADVGDLSDLRMQMQAMQNQLDNMEG